MKEDGFNWFWVSVVLAVVVGALSKSFFEWGKAVMTRLLFPAFVLACLLALAVIDPARNPPTKKNVVPAGYPNPRTYLV